MDDSLSRSIAAVRALLAPLGIACAPRVLADRSHLVLALDPEPIVARVALSTSLTRVGLDWLAREVAIARHLDAAGVPVTRPTTRIDPGPVEVDGLIVSFWELERRLEGFDAALAGARLAQVHRALATFEPDRLPAWGVVEEARTLVPRACDSGVLVASEAARLREAWEGVDALVADAARRTASFQSVHGDAHFGNVFTTDRGPLWTDWEDACRAPVEWDLATLAARHATFGEESEWLAAALGAYDRPFDRELARELVALRNLQVIPWLVVFAERQPELGGRARARLARIP